MKANSTFQRAKEANEEALSLLTQADKQLPTLDVDALRQEAQDIKDKVCSRTKLSYGSDKSVGISSMRYFIEIYFLNPKSSFSIL